MVASADHVANAYSACAANALLETWQSAAQGCSASACLPVVWSIHALCLEHDKGNHVVAQDNTPKQ